MHEVSRKYRAPRSGASRTKKGAALRKATVARRQAAAARNAAAVPAAAAAPNLPQAGASQTPKSRSAKKFEHFGSITANSVTDEEYVIIHSSCLQELVQTFACPECYQNKLKISPSERHGFCVKLTVVCSECDNIANEVYTSKRVQDEKSSRPSFDVNVKMTTAFLDVGGAHQAMVRFCSSMQMKVMAVASFYDQMKRIVEANAETREKILEEARKVVREVHSKVCPTWDPSTTLDITISIDGSWHRRGFKSLYGFVAVIDILTGLVIDCIVLSKFCLMDVLAMDQYGKDTETFKSWHKTHIEKGECSINFTGPSGNMESHGAVMLFERSLNVCNMRYISIMADGDAKTLAQINNAQPYGPNFVVGKEECINHVSKRMGAGLKEARKEEGLGGRGEGTLTENSITKLQGFYHSAIKNNLPNVKKMQDAFLASLYHCASTDKKPQHSYCPKGPSSWCFYNKRKALKKKDLGSHKDMPIKLNNKVFKALLPRYKRLSSKELMERCCSGGTTNANEALHSLVWKKSPKHIFMSRNRLEYGVTQAVGEFNMGCTALQALKSQLCNEPVASSSQAIARSLDRKRLARGEVQEKPATKRQRIVKKISKTKANKTTLYQPGGDD